MSHCPECDQPLLWGGMSWVEHTEGQHLVRRKILLRVIRRLLWEEFTFRSDALELAFLRGSVLIQWRIVLPTDIGYFRTEVPGELWDEMDHDHLLALLASTMRDGIEALKGIRPHPMQVKCRVYDERQR